MNPYASSVERFPKLRQSRLAVADRCLLQAFFEEEYRQGWSGHPQARGAIFHRFAAKAVRAMYDMGESQIPTDLAVSILEETLRQHDIDQECPTCFGPIVKRENGRIFCGDGHEHRSDFVNIPFDQIKDLRWVVIKFAHETEFDIDGLVDIEKRIQHTIRYPAEDGTYVERILTGQLDALFVTGEDDDHAIVIDYKDTWSIPAPTELDFDGYFQQRFYAWLVMREYPSIERVTLREHYVRYSEYREATVERADLEDVEAELVALAERFDRAFEEKNFPPSPGRHCQLCPRPAACPIFPGVRVEGMITDAETAERFAREAEVATAALKQRTTAMAAWAAVHGPLPVSSHKGPRVWGHKQYTRTSRPKKEELQKAIALKGGRPLTRQDIERLYKTSKGTKFEQHTPSEIEDTADDAALMAALEASIAEHESGSKAA